MAQSPGRPAPALPTSVAAWVHLGALFRPENIPCVRHSALSPIPHTSPRGPASQMRTLRLVQGQIAGRRHAWEVNQIWEIPKSRFRLVLQVVSAVRAWGGGCGLNLWSR